MDHLFINLSFGLRLLLKIMIGICIALQFVRYIERIEYSTFQHEWSIAWYRNGHGENSLIACQLDPLWLEYPYLLQWYTMP